jgi:hypothetical protein
MACPQESTAHKRTSEAFMLGCGVADRGDSGLTPERWTRHYFPTDARSTAGAHRSESWRFDAAGNLKAYKNPADQWKHFEYDDRNRQTRSYWNSSETDTTANLTIGDETLTAPDPASRVTNITTSNVTATTSVTYGYDAANHKTSEDQTLNILSILTIRTAT